MTAPTSEQLRQAWAVERHDHHTSSNGWDTCPVCGLRAALTLLTDAERRADEMNRRLRAALSCEEWQKCGRCRSCAVEARQDAEQRILEIAGDAARHIAELERDTEALVADAEVGSVHIGELMIERDNLRARLADAEAALRVEEYEHGCTRASLADAEQRMLEIAGSAARNIEGIEALLAAAERRIAAAERVIEWAASDHYANTGAKDHACERCQTLAAYDALIQQDPEHANG